VTAPDLTDQRHHAEAVAYGKLLAVREILDALAAARPTGTFNGADYLNGYERAVRVVKSLRIGVEK
jgi:hypothetical protein